MKPYNKIHSSSKYKVRANFRTAVNLSLEVTRAINYYDSQVQNKNRMNVIF